MRHHVSAVTLQTQPLLAAAQARGRDRHTIDVVGVPGLVLMEHAGRAVADVVGEVVDASAHTADGDTPIVVLCGRGNNGGDGYVCARHLLSRGYDVRVLGLVDAPDKNADVTDASSARAVFVKACAVVGHPGPEFVDVEDLPASLGAIDPGRPLPVVVDALFGIGLSRPLTGALAQVVVAVQTWRQQGAVVVAVDLPSGLPTDGEAPTGPVMEADITVTFGGEKIAHRSEPGAFLCGDVVVVDIGFVPPLDERVTVQRLTRVALPDPRRHRPMSHKGHYGHVGVVAGDVGTAGAALLAAHGALRTGAGLVSLVGPSAHADRPRPSEVMWQTLDAQDAGDDTGDVAGDDASNDAGARTFGALVVGPGLLPSTSMAPELLSLVKRVRAAGGSVVADAGALSLLPASGADVWTPHPGEAARVLNCTTSEVQADRPTAARHLARQLGGVVVLKGAVPIVATIDGAHGARERSELAQCPAPADDVRLVLVDGGAPRLSVAGSGDVLAGIIGAAVAGALGPGRLFDLVVAAVALHQGLGRSGRPGVRGVRGVRGLLASELADQVPALLHRWYRNDDEGEACPAPADDLDLGDGD